MAVCVAADPCFAGEAQLGYGPGYYGNDPGAYSASGQSDGGAEAGMEAPPSPQSTAYSGPSLLQPEAQKGCWSDWQEDQSDIMTEYAGGMPGQWSTTNSDGSWPSPPSAAASAAEWMPTPMMGRAHPTVRAKRRFCTSYPEVGTCRRGLSCTYAHTREEISANLLELEEENQEPAAMTDDFFMYKYKTRWCPKGVQHEWHTCVYAHNYQDARRPVSIGYGARLCPYWSKKDTGFEYSQRCPLGLRCPYSHGAKEQLYHPQYFKTIICRDLRGNGGGNKACPRHTLCAFYHNRSEKRTPLADEGVDYSQPLPAEGLPADWVAEFLSPPFLPEGSRHMGLEDGSGGGCGKDQMPYNPNMMQQYGMAGGMQMPYVIFMPVNNMMPSGPGCNSPTAMSPMGATSPAGNNAMQGMPNANWVMVPASGWSMDGGASPAGREVMVHASGWSMDGGASPAGREVMVPASGWSMDGGASPAQGAMC